MIKHDTNGDGKNISMNVQQLFIKSSSIYTGCAKQPIRCSHTEQATNQRGATFRTNAYPSMRLPSRHHPSKTHFGLHKWQPESAPWPPPPPSPRKLPPGLRTCPELWGRPGFCPGAAGEPAFCTPFWCPWWTHSCSPLESYRSLAYSRKMSGTTTYMDYMQCGQDRLHFD